MEISQEQVVKPPKSTSALQVEQLAYLESFDAVIDQDYALVAYKETRTDTGKWVLRIKGHRMAGTVLDPESPALKKALKTAAGHDRSSLVWGTNLQPREQDPRLVENRLLLDSDGRPSALEMRLVTRKADGSAREEKRARTAWPA